MKNLLNTTNFLRIFTVFAAVFGGFWLFLEPAGFFLPQWLDWGLAGYIGLIAVSLSAAFYANRPRKIIYQSISSPQSIIEVKVGDIFEQPDHLVIGLNDVFDTEPGKVINIDSLQNQFLERVYGGDRARLDADIDTELQLIKHTGKEDLTKKMGKNWRYPIGTTIVLGTEGRRYFLSAYGSMNSDLRVKSNIDRIWDSLRLLWEQVRLHGHGRGVSMPIIGSQLARTGLPRMFLVKLIIISFVGASKEEFVSNRLTIMVHPKDLDTIDMIELDHFLKNTLF